MKTGETKQKMLMAPRHLPIVRLLKFGPLSVPSRFSSSSSSSSPPLSLYFRRARAIDSLRLLLRRQDPANPFPIHSSSTDPFVIANSLRCAPSPEAALSLFHSLPSHTSQTIHALAKTLALSRRTGELHSLLAAVEAGSYPNTLPPSPMDRLRWFACAGDLQSSLRAFDDVRSTGRRGHPCAESYNLLLGLHASRGGDSDAVVLFEDMVREGALPNSRTYTVIIAHLVRAGKLGYALELFERLPLMRIRRTSKQYNVLAEGFASMGRFEEVKKVIEEMKIDGMLPPQGVRVAIRKMREAGFDDEEMEEFDDDMKPDSRIAYVGESSGNSSDDDVDDRGNHGCDSTKLKPWLDPNALASALSDWDTNAVEALEKAKLVWTSRLVCKILRGFKKAETAWKFFTWVAHKPGGFTHDRHTVSRMMAILARNGHDGLVEKLISKVKVEGILLPFSTIRLLVDFYGVSKRPDAALRIFRDVDSICGTISNSNHALLCSALLRTLSKCKRDADIMIILEEMLLGGVRPDKQTFSGLLQFFASEGELERVHTIFGMAKKCGIEPDSHMYQILIRAYVKYNRAALALRTFEDMRNSNLFPDSPTKSLLVKSLWGEGKRREVVYVEERCEEIGEGLPTALPGHVWTVSSTDLLWVLDIYRKSFLVRNI